MADKDQNGTPNQTGPSVNEQVPDDERALRVLVILVLAGLVAILLYSLQAYVYPPAGINVQFSQWREYLAYSVSTLFSSSVRAISIWGVGTALAGAFLLVGGLLGFLFAIPRSLRSSPLATSGVSAEEGVQNGQQTISPLYRANTNLEDISDWLTKIIVGISLTQVGQIRDGLNVYADNAAEGLGDFASSPLFATVILIFFSTDGFLVAYMWTRLHMGGALRQADLAAQGLHNDMVQLKGQFETFEQDYREQYEQNAAALTMLEQQLNAQSNSFEIPQEDLNSAVSYASPDVRSLIFQKAREIRSRYWNEDSTKSRMALTIPVFRALIEAKVDSPLHRNHAQLGYALKDQLEPDWKGAEAALSDAIENRGGEAGWPLYDFNRALCRIQKDKGFRKGKSSAEVEKNRILDDLTFASQWARIRRILAVNETVQGWLELNNLSMDDFGPENKARS